MHILRTFSHPASLLLKTIFVIATLFLQQQVYGQAGFIRKYGGTGYSRAHSIRPTTGQGYILAGTGNPITGTGWHDLIMTKLDASYQLEWMKSYGANYIDHGSCAIQTSDGGYLLTGTASDAPVSNGTYVALIKTDDIGNVQWSKWLAQSNVSVGNELYEDASGNFYVIGSTQNIFSATGMLIAKVDASGNLLWANIHTNGDTPGLDSKLTLDGGFIMSGNTDVLPSGTNMALIKTDVNGNVQWAKNYGSYLEFQCGVSVMQHPDSGFSIAGYTFSGLTGFYLLRTDVSGNLLWSRNYTDSLNDYTINACILTTTGDYLMAGYADSMFTGYSKKFVCKIDASGNLLWAKTYDAPDPQYNYGFNDILESTGNFLFTGSDGDIYLMQTDTDGNSGCMESSVVLQTYIPLTLENTPVFQTLPTTYNSNYTFNVQSGGTQNVFCVSGINEVQINSTLQILPNPCSKETIIKIPDYVQNAVFSVYNITGKTIIHRSDFSGNRITLSCDLLSDGIYMIQLLSKNVLYSGKLIVHAHNSQ